MNVEKKFIARAIEPLKKEPPSSCSKDKTINMDPTKTTLYLFRDSRKEAQEYVNLILPTLLDGQTKPDDLLAFYNKMEGQWLEFHYDTKLLYLCSLKKSNP